MTSGYLWRGARWYEGLRVPGISSTLGNPEVNPITDRGECHARYVLSNIELSHLEIQVT